MQHIKERNIEPWYEIPFNNFVLNNFDYFDKYLVNLDAKPEYITLVSFFLQLYGIQQLNLGLWTNAIIYIFVGLVLDIYDGAYARKHNMTSDWGSRFDNATGIMVLIIFMYVLFNRYSKKQCSVVISFLLILFMLSKIYRGCKTNYVGLKDNSILESQLASFCHMPKKDLERTIEKYKWVGTSHVFLLSFVIIFMFETKRIK
mgnify:CR=1 FL=1|tara:strand:- start:6925 stop:7530 length:606 start_codon:yes stop_codon:yes gene_type:complete